MATFRRSRRGPVRVSMTSHETSLLTQLLGQLIELVGPDEGAEHDTDPLASMVGIGTATEVPDDPVLARLLPDAYRDDDELAAEFRRYTEVGLRDRKVAAARQVLATLALADASGALDSRIEPGTEQAWLTSLNDLRLALGTRLDVTEDWLGDYEHLDEDDPRLPMFAVYDWLSMLQETLIRALPDPA